MTKELAKTLTTALVQFIDRERPEGTMDCSSAECERIEKAFEGGTYDVVEKLIQKKLLDMTEFELALNNLVSEEGGAFMSIQYTKEKAKTLLALAKKELARRDEVITLDKLAPYDKGFQDGKAEAMADLERTYFSNPEKLPKWLKDDIARKELNAHIKGYNKGYKDAEKQYNESVVYHSPIMPTTPSGWGCDGTHCTNPHHDCINCPVKYSSSGTITTLNTDSGTSTLKAEG